MRAVPVPPVWSWRQTISFVLVLVALVVLAVAGVIAMSATAASGGGGVSEPIGGELGASSIGAAATGAAARTVDLHPATSPWEHTPTGREVVLGWIALGVSVAVAFGARAVGKARRRWRGW